MENKQITDEFESYFELYYGWKILEERILKLEQLKTNEKKQIVTEIKKLKKDLIFNYLAIGVGIFGFLLLLSLYVSLFLNAPASISIATKIICGSFSIIPITVWSFLLKGVFKQQKKIRTEIKELRNELKNYKFKYEYLLIDLKEQLQNKKDIEIKKLSNSKQELKGIVAKEQIDTQDFKEVNYEEKYINNENLEESSQDTLIM